MARRLHRGNARTRTAVNAAHSRAALALNVRGTGMVTALNVTANPLHHAGNRIDALAPIKHGRSDLRVIRRRRDASEMGVCLLDLA